MTTNAPETPFPALLRGFREEYGLTQQQLADRLEISKNTVKAWERGDPRRQPHILTREGVKARLDFLWLGVDSKAPRPQRVPVANSPDQA